jgi:NTE family protein
MSDNNNIEEDECEVITTDTHSENHNENESSEDEKEEDGFPVDIDLDLKLENDVELEQHYMKEVEEEKEEVVMHHYDTLVLSGNSVKGFYVLGALQYCYDNYLLSAIENYVGTSSGAMISFLMVIGYTPVEIVTSICCHQVMERMQHFDIFAMMNNLGAISFTSIAQHLERMTIDKIGYLPTFYDLKHKFKKNFTCVTYNLTKGVIEYLNYESHPTLPCLVAIRMTSNLPLVFENYKYDNNLYTDGGLVNNFAIDYGEKIGMRVLGIYLEFENAIFSNTDNILEFIYKLIYIPIRQQQQSKVERINKTKCRIVPIGKALGENQNTFNFKLTTVEKLEMFSSGYRQCKATL